MNPEKTDFSSGFNTPKETLIAKINGWNNRKTKITGKYDANIIAKEFDEFLQNNYHQFLQDMWDALSLATNYVDTNLNSWYQKALVDMLFVPSGIKSPNFEFNSIPVIKDDLLGLKEENYVVQKDLFLGRLFKQSSNSSPETILETVYYYQKWREHGIYVVKPYANIIIDKCIAEIEAYFYSMSAVYKGHLQQLIEEKISEKNDLSSQLSEDEKHLQDDNDWVVQFTDKLKAIARD